MLEHDVYDVTNVENDNTVTKENRSVSGVNKSS